MGVTYRRIWDFSSASFRRTRRTADGRSAVSVNNGNGGVFTSDVPFYTERRLMPHDPLSSAASSVMRTAGSRALSSGPAAGVRQDKPAVQVPRRPGTGTDAAASSVLPVAGMARAAGARPRDGDTNRPASPGVLVRKASSGPGLACRRLPLVVAGGRRGPLRLRHRHPDQLSGSSPGFGRRPLGLV